MQKKVIGSLTGSELKIYLMLLEKSVDGVANISQEVKLEICEQMKLKMNTVYMGLHKMSRLGVLSKVGKGKFYNIKNILNEND